MQPKLSDLLAEAKADAPAPRYGVEDVVRAGRRLRKRRRTAWTSAAAALVVVAVGAAIGVPRLLATPDRDSPASVVLFDYPADNLVASIKSYEVGPLTVTAAVQVTPGYQIAQILGPQELAAVRSVSRAAVPALGTVTVYRKGAFSPVRFATGAVVRVNGATGRYVQDAAAGPALAWQYADDSWAVVQAWNAALTRDQLVEIAVGLRSAPPRPPAIGFKLSAVPAGYRLDSGGSAADPAGRTALPGGFHLRLLKGAVSYRNLPGVLADPQSVGAHLVGVIEVTVRPQRFSSNLALAGPPGDFPFCITDQNSCYLESGDHHWEIEAHGGIGTPTAELTSLVRGAAFADPDDPATWHPLAGVIG